MMDHLSLYKGFESFLILAFTSSSARCSTTRVILAMIFSLSPQRLSCSRKSYHWWQVGISNSSGLGRTGAIPRGHTVNRAHTHQLKEWVIMKKGGIPIGANLRKKR